ncbi:hypothetical protein ILYODFUR_007717 [Ilyodon furcidens]|uniref:Uncharacterized protein n=1 Tax=Ilyodon furcidens TaxID=33524 RepID=A0ABV0VC10_9TELE
MCSVDSSHSPSHGLNIQAHILHTDIAIHTHIPAVVPAPNVLTSSLSTPLSSFSRPPSQAITGVELRHNELRNGGEGGSARDGMNTLLSSLFSATHEKMSF